MTMKKRIRTCLTALLLLVLAVSGVMILRQQLQYQDSANSYDSAASLAKIPTTPAVPAASGKEEVPAQADGEPEEEPMPAIDLAALQAVNPDVAGWICIPDTELSYPILQGEDNDFYLKYTWDRVRNDGGSIFLDWRCSPDFSDFHTVIYGHRMRNGSMFGMLKYYKDSKFWQEHPTISIVDGSGVHSYDIFSAWEPSVTSVVYQMDFDTEEGKQEFLNTCYTQSQLDTGVIPGLEGKILTLSTCTGSGHATRWVVQAVERRTELP